MSSHTHQPLVRIWIACRSMPRYSVLWWAIVGSFLIPIWTFHYFPSQDGPAHLANSQVLRAYIRGEGVARQFYFIAWRPIPNWTIFALLASFSTVAPPPVAEKLLLTLYVVGFACSYRYFLGALGNNTALFSLAGFLLVFNRCLWMGFYNYCLSLVLYFVVTGFLLRNGERFQLRQMLLFSALVLLTYLTHLFGFILTVISSLWFAAIVSPRNWKKTMNVLVAIAPCLILTLWYFTLASFSETGVFEKLRTYLLGWVTGNDQLDRLEDSLGQYEMDLFGVNMDFSFTVGMGSLFLFVLFVLVFFTRPEATPEEMKSRRRAVMALGLGFLILYLLIPDRLVFGKGGYFKARLTPLAPLLWLACLQLPHEKIERRLLASLTTIMLVVNLLSVYFFIEAENRVIREFAGGSSSVGSGQVIVIVGGKQKPLPVNPLEHADQYYCMTGHNVCFVDNFTTLSHSVVRLRPPFELVREELEKNPAQEVVGAIAVWNSAVDAQPPPGFELVYQNGKLKVFRREKGRIGEKLR